jgi:ATP-binding cassette subfamily B multidrug efflux pump
MDIAIKATRIIVMMMPVMMLILNTSIVIVLWYGGHQVWDSKIQVGELIAFLNYVTQVLISLMLVSMVLMNLSRAKASSERINEVFELNSEITNSEHARKDAIQTGQVVFDHVSFSYLADEPERVLKDICFTVQPGQTVAILGATGSGKTSLVNLISRLYDVDEGRVLIDGADVRDIDLYHLRTQIGVVLQEAILFTGTIAENISFGKPDASLEQVEAAARAAQIHDYIVDLPDGYQTLIGQRGVNLSGGQKQRVSIARAILVQPTILIMDDSTSAVDLGTEYRIQQALKAQTKRSTSFIIAQRISSVLEADIILVLDEGRLVAEGTHLELMASSRVYQDIYRSQLGKEDVVNG